MAHSNEATLKFKLGLKLLNYMLKKVIIKIYEKIPAFSSDGMMIQVTKFSYR